MKIFYTAYLVNEWKDIIIKHLQLMKQSQLLKNISQFNIFAYPKNEQLNQIIKQYNQLNNIKIYFQQKNQYQFPALKFLIQNNDNFNLYLHTKGVTRNNIYTKNWNEYMSYFVIQHWRDCINYLKQEKGDAIGVDWEYNNHFSGNFWWTTKEHIQKLKNFYFTDRWSAELFIGSISGKYICLCQSKAYNLYKQIFPKQKWIMTKQIFRK